MPAESSRSVLITGAARGIGRAVAQALLGDGHRVCFVDVNPDSLGQCREEVGEGSDRHFVVGDVTSEDDCARSVSETRDAFGGLEALINNAGIGVSSLRPDAEVNHPGIEELTPEIWQRFFDINVLGAVRMTRASIGHLKAAGWGRIINNTTSYLTMH